MEMREYLEKKKMLVELGLYLESCKDLHLQYLFSSAQVIERALGNNMKQLLFSFLSNQYFYIQKVMKLFNLMPLRGSRYPNILCTMQPNLGMIITQWDHIPVMIDLYLLQKK